MGKVIPDARPKPHAFTITAAMYDGLHITQTVASVAAAIEVADHWVLYGVRDDGEPRSVHGFVLHPPHAIRTIKCEPLKVVTDG